MKQDLQDKLFKAFPILFVQKDWDKKETCMCWGIDIPDEWYDVFYKLCEAIQVYCDLKENRQIEFTQVKEKFGTLKVYYTNHYKNKDPFIDGMIWLANQIVSDESYFARRVNPCCS